MPTFVSVVQFCRSELFRVPHTFTAVTGRNHGNTHDLCGDMVRAE